MHYAIINFTRLGDLLQTQSTIAALKKNGDHHISLICLENFASAATFISELDNISIFPSASILKEIQTDWRQALYTLDSWIADYYKSFPFEVVLNLTPTISCRIFAQLLSRTNKHIRMEGFGLDSFGFGQNSSAWTNYVQAVTQERGCSPYNLIDGFRSMLSLPPEPFHLKKPQTTLLNAAHSLLNTEKLSLCNQFPSIHEQELSFVGFQLGASDEKRQWDPKNFAELGKMLWEKRKIVPVLLGSNSELGITQQYIAHNKALNKETPYINLCGKTNLEELGAVLCELKSLVSNDTGTLHLAVGLGTAVLGIYLATAQVWDTGPYGEKHLCIEPRLDCHPCSFNFQCPYNFKCRQHVSAQSAYNALCILLDNPKDSNAKNSKENIKNTKTKNIENISLVCDDAQVWQSYFDENGFVSYKSISGDDNSDRTLWMECQRIFYKNLLDVMDANNLKAMNTDTIATIATIGTTGSIGTIATADATTTNDYITQKFPVVPIPHLKNNAFIAENIDFIQRLRSLILLAREQAFMLSVRPNVKLQEGFLSTIQRINSYFQQNPSFTPLFLLWKNLIQENGESMENLIHFFDTLHRELSFFENYLVTSST